MTARAPRKDFGLNETPMEMVGSCGLRSSHAPGAMGAGSRFVRERPAALTRESRRLTKAREDGARLDVRLLRRRGAGCLRS